MYSEDLKQMRMLKFGSQKSGIDALVDAVLDLFQLVIAKVLAFNYNRLPICCAQIATNVADIVLAIVK